MQCYRLVERVRLTGYPKHFALRLLAKTSSHGELELRETTSPNSFLSVGASAVQRAYHRHSWQELEVCEKRSHYVSIFSLSNVPPAKTLKRIRLTAMYWFLSLIFLTAYTQAVDVPWANGPYANVTVDLCFRENSPACQERRFLGCWNTSRLVQNVTNYATGIQLSTTLPSTPRPTGHTCSDWCRQRGYPLSAFSADRFCRCGYFWHTKGVALSDACAPCPDNPSVNCTTSGYSMVVYYRPPRKSCRSVSFMLLAVTAVWSASWRCYCMTYHRCNLCTVMWESYHHLARLAKNIPGEPPHSPPPLSPFRTLPAHQSNRIFATPGFVEFASAISLRWSCSTFKERSCIWFYWTGELSKHQTLG